MPTKNVNLTEHYSQLVDALIASGQYKNASEVFRAGLRLLEQSTEADQQKLALLRRLADQGFDEIDQGRGIELPTPKSLKSHIAKLGRRAASNG
jgi:antitoxin ParD1/3/4